MICGKINSKNDIVVVYEEEWSCYRNTKGK